MVRLIRSKGVGVYFITQNPTDIPESILGQLGNRIQHALRAYTPKDQKAVRAAAETFRANPSFKTDEAITTLETGEALVSFLDEKGAPSMVQRARILFPLSQIGPVTEGQRLDNRQLSPLKAKYDQFIDRESAYEVLLAREQEQQALAGQQEAELEQQEAKARGKSNDKLRKIGGAVLTAAATAAISSVSRSAGNAVAGAVSGKKTTKKTGGKSVAGKALSSATSSALRTLTRSLLGSLIK